MKIKTYYNIAIVFGTLGLFGAIAFAERVSEQMATIWFVSCYSLAIASFSFYYAGKCSSSTRGKNNG